ncbi:MAG: YdeI/OmpD-associated family protein [Thermoplasmata archaeon]|jgi:uncharacterized protein YdeI (YjbR/CyaY-like superfamily)
MARSGEARLSVRFFARREQLRAWFEKNHATAKELWIGYYKADARRKAVTYLEAVEEALCFGWIDGQVRSLDEMRYANRYSPRRPESRWSEVNFAKVGALSRTGRMHPAGLKVFAERTRGEAAGYSLEERPMQLASPLARQFRGTKKAWRFFQTQPPSYRRTTTFWVMSARRDGTRLRRLRILIEESRQGRRLDLLRPGSRREPR